MVLSKNFRSTTFFNAFILHASILSIITVLSNVIFFLLKSYLDNIPYIINILLTLVLVFILSFCIHLFFFYTFAYGGGMLSPLHHKGPYKLFGR